MPLQYQLVVDALLGMEIASPDDLKPAIESVAETVGSIMNLMLGSSSGKDLMWSHQYNNDIGHYVGSASNNKTGNGTSAEEDPCANIAVIDKVCET